MVAGFRSKAGRLYALVIAYSELVAVASYAFNCCRKPWLAEVAS